MITSFKIFENYDIGVSWVDPKIKDILERYNIRIDFSMGNYFAVLYYIGTSQSYDISKGKVLSSDLYDLFISLEKTLGGISKHLYVVDEICEYVVREINPNLFFKLEKYMNIKLIKKLENDPEIGPIITANKYNL